MAIINNTIFDPITIARDGQKLGQSYSHWRERLIDLFQHPFLEDRVISIGYTEAGDWICCEESKSLWQEALAWCQRHPGQTHEAW